MCTLRQLVELLKQITYRYIMLLESHEAFGAVPVSIVHNM